MRYQFIGPKIKQVGKTLWEIVGNLKDFGVGRLIKKHSHNNTDGPSFYKIVQVQVLPPSRQQFENRPVKVWVEEVYNGVTKPVKHIVLATKLPQYTLIPKIEEEQYYKQLENVDEERGKIYIKKYVSWPPLYKILWEQQSQLEGKVETLPGLETKHATYDGYEIVLKDETYEPTTCSLYKSDTTVEDMYKEMLKLKLLIKEKQGVQKE